MKQGKDQIKLPPAAPSSSYSRFPSQIKEKLSSGLQFSLLIILLPTSFHLKLLLQVPLKDSLCVSFPPIL